MKCPVFNLCVNDFAATTKINKKKFNAGNTVRAFRHQRFCWHRMQTITIKTKTSASYGMVWSEQAAAAAAPLTNDQTNTSAAAHRSLDCVSSSSSSPSPFFLYCFILVQRTETYIGCTHTLSVSWKNWIDALRHGWWGYCDQLNKQSFWVQFIQLNFLDWNKFL